MMAHPDSNHHVDISDVIEAKLSALRAHVSQTGHMEGFEERMRGWFGLNAAAAGLPEGRLAERFFVVATA
jgi:LmbE family N-acetylglucosaminyl deacetylase